MSKGDSKFGKACDYNIHIMPTENHGFIVEVGCRRFAFEGKNNMLRELRKFLEDPKGKEDELKKVNEPRENPYMEEEYKARVEDRSGAMRRDDRCTPLIDHPQVGPDPEQAGES